MNFPYLLSHYTIRPPTEYEGVILRDLIDRDYTTRDRLISQLYDHQYDGGPLSAERCLDQFIFKLRRKMKPDWSIRRHRARELFLNYEGI